MGWIEKVEPKAIPNLHILSLHQLRSLLLSSPKADETSVQGRECFKEISSVLLSLPDIRSEPLETRPGHVYLALKKRLSAMSEGAKQRSVVVGEDGVERVDEREEDGGRELCCGGKKRSREVVKKTGCVGGRRGGKIREEMSGSLANTFNLKKLCDANCTSGRASSRFSADWQRRSEVLYIIQWPPWCCH